MATIDRTDIGAAEVRTSASPASPTPHTPWARALGLAVAAAAVVVTVLLAFLWPTVTSSVKDLPIAVAGPSAAVTAVEKQLDTAADDAFAVTGVDDRAAAVELIRTRDVYGAIVLGEKPEVLTASANGAVVSQLLGQVAGKLQAQAQQQADAAVQQAIAAGKAPAGTEAPTIQVPVTDVVPLASTDARGVGLTASAFPLVLGGMLGGILISILVAGSWRRLAAVTAYAVVTGLAVTGVMQGWFGILQGGYWLNAAAVSLSMFATAAFIVGMNALLGRVGIAVGAVLTMLIGNPLASAAQPLQFLPGPWGEIGQWFVPGASVSLLRDLSYFPDANAAFPWLVLAAWGAVGVVAMLAGHFRNQEVSEAAA
ncbi:ABC transporter permease [Leifsonia sp. F6_8S_P_1B]|uniref:ABC transporter permease n=1 Tax=Leifsonia williamsii TaxID=3035919 RepID=A0ABT8K6Y5_9MICO|nr:ABC transporter permease [Leifsonia williamsii]MDN4613203.1 ABC transporter permease [Leifsonia williamsii]